MLTWQTKINPGLICFSRSTSLKKKKQTEDTLPFGLLKKEHRPKIKSKHEKYLA